MRPERSLIRALATWPRRRWIAIGAVTALLGGAGGAGAGFALGSASWRIPALVLGLMLGAGFGGAMPLTLYLGVRNSWRTEQGLATLEALVNVRPLSGPLPLSLGGWAADPALMDVLLRLLADRRPDLVVECGSGWSTVLLARCLAELGRGRLIAFEHDERFAEQSRALLSPYEAGERVRVVHAPLAERDVDGERRLWYGPQVEAALDDDPSGSLIGVLLVDGPPGGAAARSRYPVVPVLRSRLSDDGVILLDDGYREDEAWAAREWGRSLGVEPRFVASGHGIWRLDLATRTTSSGFS